MRDTVEAGNVLATISSRYMSFTNSEKLVADVVMSHTEEFLEESVMGVAALAGVGEATVIRFCRKLGFKGFQSFKMILAAEVMQYRSSSPHQTGEFQPKLQVMQNDYCQAIGETVQMLDPVQVQRACNLILQGKKTLFFGVASSGLTALEAKFKFMRIGFDVDAATDGHMMAMQASLLENSDVAVGISYSGAAIDTVEALRQAHESGAKTICLTHFIDSEIMKYADVPLLVGARETPGMQTVFASKLSTLFVLDILYNEIIGPIREIAQKKQVHTINVVRERFI